VEIGTVVRGHSLLARFRAMFLCFATVVTVLSSVGVTQVGNVAVPVRAGVVAASLAVLAWWIAGFWRGHFPVVTELLEWPAVVGPLLVMGSVNGGIGTVFAAIFFRSLYGSRRMAAVRTVLILAGAGSALLYGPLSGDTAAPDPGLLMIWALLPTFWSFLGGLLRQHDRLVRREKVLRAGSQTVASTRDPDEIRDAAVRIALELAGRPGQVAVTLGIRRGDRATVVRAAGAGTDELVGQAFEFAHLPAEQGARLARGEPVVIQDHGVGQLGPAAKFGARQGGVLILPLRAGGQELGALTVSSEQELPKEIQTSLTTWAVQVATALEGAELHAELSRRAFTDPLTELANRARIDERLTTAVQTCPAEQQVAFLLLDLDKFKPVNDQYGHHAGDDLLRQIARRLEQCVRCADSVGRLGGDEFAVVLPGLSAPEDAVDVARRLIIALEQPFTVEAHEVTVGASVGIAYVQPEPAVRPERLVEVVRAADAAMYQAKQARTGGWVVYDPAAHAAA
jgi:diguanylate cyclase (GGDEF)-like protein